MPVLRETRRLRKAREVVVMVVVVVVVVGFARKNTGEIIIGNILVVPDAGTAHSSIPRRCWTAPESSASTSSHKTQAETPISTAPTRP